jgi:putative ABC transport system substrate-binding protein
MNRRELLGLTASSLVCAAVPAGLLAQPAARPYRVYMVTWRGITAVEKGFQDYLASRSIQVDYIMRDAGQNPKRLGEFVEEIRRVKPDLVYTWGTSTTLGIVGPHDRREGYIQDIPVVFTLVAAPVGAKIVPNLASSERNVTGVCHVAPLEAQLSAMRAYRPFRKLGVLYNAAEQNSVAGVRELNDAARTDRFELLEKTFRRDTSGKPLVAGIAEMVLELKRAGAEWLYIGPDSFLFTRLSEVVAAAIDAKLPTFASTEAVIDSPAGVLTGLVSKYHSVGQFTAYKAEQILVGRHAPRTIPVETLKRFSFIVRMDAARKIGLLPPVSLFNYAEFV